MLQKLYYETKTLNNILKIYIKDMKYNICYGPIRWQISTSVKVVLEHFSPALTVFEIFTVQNS